MGHILNVIYLLVILLASPWLLYKSITTGKYRRGLWTKFAGGAFVRTGDKPCVWLHGVSVGEIHLLRQVVGEFRRRYRDWECVISTTTDTGFDEARRCFADLNVFYWPLDFTWAARRALQRVRPNMVVVAESEVWPNFLAAAKRQGVQLALINARMSPRTRRRYSRIRWLVQSIFRRFDVITAQNEEYAAAFRSLGSRNVRVTGSVKYDGVSFERRQPRTLELRRLFNMRDNDVALVAGSTQAPEEEIVLGIYRRAKERHANLRLVIVPRQKERFDDVARLLEQSCLPFVRRSELKAPVAEAPIVLVDTFGELSAVWGLADIAFVGGSLDGKRGGQNMIEPAACGAAVLFGPHTWNFKETVTQLLRHDGAMCVATAAQLEEKVLHLLADENARARLGKAAVSYVRSQQGATHRTIDALVAVAVDGLSKRAA
jgi:3-deoxy-D-manno-octulosonic-acid transferase